MYQSINKTSLSRRTYTALLSISLVTYGFLGKLETDSITLQPIYDIISNRYFHTLMRTIYTLIH